MAETFRPDNMQWNESERCTRRRLASLLIALLGAATVYTHIESSHIAVPFGAAGTILALLVALHPNGCRHEENTHSDLTEKNEFVKLDDED